MLSIWLYNANYMTLQCKLYDFALWTIWLYSANYMTLHCELYDFALWTIWVCDAERYKSHMLWAVKTAVFSHFPATCPKILQKNMPLSICYFIDNQQVTKWRKLRRNISARRQYATGCRNTLNIKHLRKIPFSLKIFACTTKSAWKIKTEVKGMLLELHTAIFRKTESSPL